MQSTQECEGFAMLKSGVTFNEDAKCLGHLTNKTDVGVKETVLEADEVRSVKLLKQWEFCWGQFRTF
jgi:hypothetical protein